MTDLSQTPPAGTKELGRLASMFPTYGESNIRWFYIITFLMSSWFQIGNWILFVLLFMSVREFAVYEAVAFGLGILLEIPSGAFADLLGKRRTILIGFFMQAIGSILFTLGYFGNELIFIGNVLIICAFALRSGSLEALVYDTLVEKGKTEHFDNIIGKSKSLHLLSLMTAGLLGGLAWRYSVYLPWALTSAAFVVGAVLSFKFIEPKVDTEAFTIKNFFLQNKRGFHYLFKSDFKKYTFSFALIMGSYYMWHTGIIRVLMGADFGYGGETLNYLISATFVLGFWLSFNFKRIRQRLGDRRGFTFLMLLASAAWLATGLLTGSVPLGFFVFMAITGSGVLSEVWTSVVLNKHVHSKDRATAISTLSFLVQIPYVLVVVLFGSLVESGGAGPFYVVTGALLALGALSFWWAERPRVASVRTNQ